MRSGPFRRIGAIWLLALAPGALGAQATDEELFQSGREALTQHNFVDALANLYAYAHRYPLAMQVDPAHRDEVTGAINVAGKYLKDVIVHERQLLEEISQLRQRDGVGSRVSGLGQPPPPLRQPGANPAAYRMVCRGGGRMTFSLMRAGWGLVGPMLAIEFVRAAGGGLEALLPGQCTWLDRPISTEEPSRICHKFETGELDLHWSVDGAVQQLGSNRVPYVQVLISPESTYEFMVFNNGLGCMVHVGPAANPRVNRPGR